MSTLTPEQNLIQEVLLENLKEQKRKRRWGIFFKLFYVLLFFITIGLLLPEEIESYNKPHTALIDINGVIQDDDDASADNIATSLNAAFKNKNVKAIILRINSPGGSPVQAAYVYDEIRRQQKLHKDIKVYAVCTDLCASAAYYIASASDQIYANPSSMVGSIGALLNAFGFTGSMDKLGIQRRLITAGKNKGFLDPFSPLKPEDVDDAQRMLNNVHQEFIQSVIAGRGKRLPNNPDLFTGKVWTGRDALRLGLIDGLGSTGYVARDVIKQENIINYTIKPNYLDRLSKHIGTSIGQVINQSLRFETPAAKLR
jgi:protease-4